MKKLKKDGWGIGSYQSAFRTSLEHSLQDIVGILENSQNLRPGDEYEIFNAKSMEYVLSDLLRKNGYSEYQYDFRTSELARMSFEMMVNYLSEFPEFKNQKDIIKNLIKPLSGYFEILSRSTLSHEDNEKTISKEEQEVIKNYLKKHDYKNEFIQLKQKIQKLYLELYKIEIKNQTESTEEVIEGEYQTESTEKIIKEDIQLKEKRIKEIQKEGFIIEGYLNRQSNVYNHLESYISRIKPLDEFDYMLKRFGFNTSYVVDVDSEINEDKAMQEFQDKMWEKYSKKITSKKTLVKALKENSIIIQHSKKEGMVPIPTSIFNKELRGFFKAKKLGDKFGTPKHYTLSDEN